jgi:hypothetical protein
MNNTSNKDIRFLPCELTQKDEAEIVEFYNHQPSDGLIHFQLDRSPSFFDALSVEGYNNRVIAIKDTKEDSISGIAIKSEKKCYINGKQMLVGYCSGLRVNKFIYNGIVLGRLFREFVRENSKETCKYYLASVLDENIKTKNLFTSGKAGIPVFKDLGLYHTCIFKPGKVRIPKIKDEDILIRRAKENDIEFLIQFLNKEGSKKQFFPVLKASDINYNKGFLKGLKIEDVHLAFRGRELVGTLALWKQTDFRKWIAKAYSGKFKAIKSIYNAYSRVFGDIVLPKAGKAIEYKILSLICIKDNSQSVFQSLLKRVLNDEKKNRNSCLAVGFHESCSLFNDLRIKGIKLKSRIFLTYVSDVNKISDSINGKEYYIDLGGL